MLLSRDTKKTQAGLGLLVLRYERFEQWLCDFQNSHVLVRGPDGAS